MSKMSNSGLRRLVGASAVAAVAAVGLASMGAGNAAAGPLPSGSKTTVGVDGSSVKITRTAESVYPVPSVANNGAGRAAEVNGNIFVNVKGGDVKGTIETGYVIGCQINITGLSGGLSATISPLGGGGGVSGSLSVPLQPGQIARVALKSKDFSKAGNYAIQYKRQDVDIQQCGGYAQVRAYTQVEIKGDFYIKSTLYGFPATIN